MRDIKIGDPVFQRNLLLFPIYDANGKNGDYNKLKTIEEAHREGFGKFEELKNPDVSRIIFRNSGNYPVFAIDGEEVLGALQNRVINTAFFSEPNTVIEVPVSCVEEGRWEGKRSFSASGTALYPSLRAVLLKTTNKNLSRYKTYRSEQSIVWENIRSTLYSLRVSSRTLSVHDAFRGYESQIEWYLENLDFGEAKGLIAFAGSRFICMDLFISPSLFKKFMPKILRGYALDALLLRENPTDLIKPEEAKKVVDKILRVKMKKYPAVGKGVEFRGEGEGIIVRGLKEKEDEEFLHLAVFPDIKI